MEESKKKPLMIAAIIVCLIAALAITFTGKSSKNTGIDRYAGQEQWLKCTNPDCGAEYTMDKKEYLEWHQKHYAVSSAQGTGMTCKECGENTAMEAVKCEKCGYVFLRGAAGIGFSDRCPECGFSKIEEERKQGRQAR
jgi:predicted Zn-ribbon and HTH transcriptional regulator